MAATGNTPSPRRRTRARTVGLTVAGGAVVAAFAAVVVVPAAVDWFENRHDLASSYATGSKAKADRESVPRWLPDDARAVEYAMKTTGGDRLLKATLPKGGLPAACTPFKESAAPRPPALKAGWFPKSAANPTARCGLYYVYAEGDTLYAWQAHDDWVASNKRERGDKG
ncbi:hypothetical protein [Streptomyces sp. cg36]|uniref:hypothetical protein n=1 Tax=Streptomyces sp. cg36 TaxID=3238798 RepID=UPI0034E2CF38